jgi:hypothetical protein
LDDARHPARRVRGATYVPDDPGDAGWHTEGSYTVEGDQGHWLNLRPRGRALLMLFLFSDTGPDDAPTQIKVGSQSMPLLSPLTLHLLRAADILGGVIGSIMKATEGKA